VKTASTVHLYVASLYSDARVPTFCSSCSSHYWTLPEICYNGKLHYTEQAYYLSTCAVAMWYGTGLAIPTGSINEYQRKLGSKRAYHPMHWPRIRGLAASAGVQLRATGNGDQRRPIGHLGSGRTLFYFFLLYIRCSARKYIVCISWTVQSTTGSFTIRNRRIAAWRWGIQWAECAIGLSNNSEAHAKERCYVTEMICTIWNHPI